MYTDQIDPKFYTGIISIDDEGLDLEDAIDAIGKKVSACYTSWSKVKSKFSRKAKEISKIYDMENVRKDGSEKNVNPWKHGLTYASIESLSDTLTQLILPDIDYLSLTLAEPKGKELEYKSIAMDLIKRIDLENLLHEAIRDAALYYGSIVRHTFSQRYNPFLDKTIWMPKPVLVKWKDWFLDPDVKAKDGAKIIQWRRTKQELMEDVKDGLYCPYHTEEAVKYNSYGDEDSDSEYSSREESSDADCFLIREYVGRLHHDKIGLDNEILFITMCNDKVLRIVKNTMPRGFDPIDYVAFHPHPVSKAYCISLGGIIVEFDKRNGRLGSAIDLYSTIAAAPPVMIPEDLITEYGEEEYAFEPFATWPIRAGGKDQIGTFRVQADLSAAANEMRQGEQRCEMITGITTPMQGGQLDHKVKPTIGNLQEKGSTTRLNSYVTLISPVVSSIVNKQMLLFCHYNGIEFKGEFSIDGIKDTKLSMSRMQQFWASMSIILQDPEMSAKLNRDIILNDIIGMMTVTGANPKKYIKPPPPPMPPQVPGMPQGDMGMAPGQPPPQNGPQPQIQLPPQ